MKNSGVWWREQVRDYLVFWCVLVPAAIGIYTYSVVTGREASWP